MSVLKSKRKESKFEVFHHFYIVRKELTALVYKNFGYKEEIKDGSFEKFFIEGEAKHLIDSILSTQKYITLANSIYPNHLSECDERRKFQDLAIGMHYELLQELQFVLETLTTIDKNKYTPYVEMITKEIALLKGWRQADNTLRKKIEEKIAEEKIEGESDKEN